MDLVESAVTYPQPGSSMSVVPKAAVTNYDVLDAFK